MNLQVCCLHLLTLETSQHSQKQWMEAMWRPADWKGEQSNRKEKDKRSKRSKWVLDRHCCCYLFIQHTTHNTQHTQQQQSQSHELWYWAKPTKARPPKQLLGVIASIYFPMKRKLCSWICEQELSDKSNTYPLLPSM